MTHLPAPSPLSILTASPTRKSRGWGQGEHTGAPGHQEISNLDIEESISTFSSYSL